MIPNGIVMQIQLNKKGQASARPLHQQFFTVTAIIASMFLYACNASSGAPLDATVAPQNLPVVALAPMPAATYQEFTASLEGSKDIEIRAQVNGYLDNIFVDEGAQVHKGQLLFRINQRIYQE